MHSPLKVYVRPLSPAKIKESLLLRLPTKQEGEALWTQAQRVNGLVALMGNPFLMSLVVDALPRLSKDKRINRSAVYAAPQR